MTRGRPTPDARRLGKTAWIEMYRDMNRSDVNRDELSLDRKR